MILAFLIFALYAVNAANVAAIAAKQYGRVGLTCGLFMLINYFHVKLVVQAATLTDVVLYVIGGIGGELFGVWLGHKLDERKKRKAES